MSGVFRSLGPSAVMEQCRLAGEWARRYAAMGFNPLPSRADAKRPALGTYKRWLEEPIPLEWLRDWTWPNIQLVMGRRWGICCVEVDGQEAFRIWRSWIPAGDLIGCWASASPILGPCGAKDFTSSRHFFFSWPLMSDGTEADIPITVLWTKDGKSHHEIRFVGDRGLMVVPPSIHPVRRTRYEWLSGGDGIADLTRMPEWLLLKVLASRSVKAPLPPRPPQLDRRRAQGSSFRRDEVLAALGDRKVEIARSYGLETIGDGEPYVRCRAPERADRNPSCSIDRHTGRFFDWARNESMSFWDLLVLLDPATFPTWQDAVDRLGRSYLRGRR